MIFIALLVLTTTFIAGSAAFFSVYGLASTFSGTFWSVVLMGASLEAGKLISASYLYRYWDTTNRWLKGYLMAGVATLMILTSTGIFGYLSSGYQTDVLPLKQAEAQVKVLEDEKVRLIARKTQIDEQIAQLPTNSVRGRTALIKGFKDEQSSVTKRISVLDQEILTNKTALIKTQAHIGPITYIAAAFGLDTDNATKYLIYLIIFAFDPMAVALTLAVNIAIRLRKEEQEEEARLAHEERMRKMQLEHDERMMADRLAREEAVEVIAPVMVTEDFIDHFGHPDNKGSLVTELPPASPELAEEMRKAFPDYYDSQEDVEHSHTAEPLPDEPDVCDAEPSPEHIVEHEAEIAAEPDDPKPVAEEVVEELERPGDHLLDAEPVEEPTPPPVRRRQRPYGQINTVLSDAKLNELVQHYQWLKSKAAVGEGLTQDDRWELSAIEEILKKHGLGMYLG